MSIADEFRAKIWCPFEKGINESSRFRIIRDPMSEAMQCALATSIVPNRQQSLKNTKYLGVEIAPLRHFRRTMNGQNIPPHVAGAVQWIGSRFIQLRKMR